MRAGSLGKVASGGRWAGSNALAVAVNIDDLQEGGTVVDTFLDVFDEMKDVSLLVVLLRGRDAEEGPAAVEACAKHGVQTLGMLRVTRFLGAASSLSPAAIARDETKAELLVTLLSGTEAEIRQATAAATTMPIKLTGRNLKDKKVKIRKRMARDSNVFVYDWTSS